MLFSITENVQGEIVRELLFPVNPSRVQVQTAAKMQTFSPIELGDIVLPRGSAPYRVTFDGVFPGSPGRIPLAIPPDPVNGDLGSWSEPMDLIVLLDNWSHPERFATPTGTLFFSVTDSPVQTDVYIDNFTYTVSGGFGDVEYSINLVEARPLFIYELGTTPEGTAQDQLAGNSGEPLSTDPTPGTYYTSDEDSIYEIAKTQLGDMDRAQEIIDLNSDKEYPDGLINNVDGSLMDPENLPGGITLQLPQ